MTTTITEATSITPPTTNGGRMLIQLITPGTGSSGVYPAEVLEAAARNEVFPAGTLLFADHPSIQEERDRPERSIRDVAGVLTENASWDGTALVAEARTYEPWSSVLAQMSDAIGVSIRASARVDESDAEGRPVIAELIEGLSVDFVTYPGRGGAIREVYESRRPAVQVVETAPDHAGASAAAPDDSPSVSAGVAMESHERKEPTVAQIQIDEAEHKRLTEAAEKAATAEAEIAEAVKRAEDAEARIAAANEAADAAEADRVIAAAGATFNAWEAKGLRADLPRTEAGRLDVPAFEKTVAEAAAVKAEAAGQGRPTGFGASESTTTFTEADLDQVLGIQKGA